MLSRQNYSCLPTAEQNTEKRLAPRFTSVSQLFFRLPQCSCPVMIIMWPVGVQLPLVVKSFPISHGMVCNSTLWCTLSPIRWSYGDDGIVNHLKMSAFSICCVALFPYFKPLFNPLKPSFTVRCSWWALIVQAAAMCSTTSQFAVCLSVRRAETSWETVDRRDRSDWLLTFSE